jgi:hypothetical protein
VSGAQGPFHGLDEALRNPVAFIVVTSNVEHGYRVPLIGRLQEPFQYSYTVLVDAQTQKVEASGSALPYRVVLVSGLAVPEHS